MLRERNRTDLRRIFGPFADPVPNTCSQRTYVLSIPRIEPVSVSPRPPGQSSADFIRNGTIVPFMASGSLRDGRRRPSRKATPTGPHATDPLAWSALNRLAPIYV